MRVCIDVRLADEEKLTEPRRRQLSSLGICSTCLSNTPGSRRSGKIETNRASSRDLQGWLKRRSNQQSCVEEIVLWHTRMASEILCPFEHHLLVSTFLFFACPFWNQRGEPLPFDD